MIPIKSYSSRELSAAGVRRVSCLWQEETATRGAPHLHREEDRWSGEESSEARA